jgi:uncharacterized protein (DUF1800 family)
MQQMRSRTVPTKTPAAPSRVAPGFFGLQPRSPAEVLAAGRPPGLPRLEAASLSYHGDLAALVAVADAVADAVPVAAGVITPEQRLVQRTTLGATQAGLARIAQLGYVGYLNEQLNYAALDDRALEAQLTEAFPRINWTPAQLYHDESEEGYGASYELMMATLYRQIHSPRQLFETMCVFWSDHFSIDINADTGALFKLADQRNVIRRHAMTTFPRLLAASAHSAAMLAYLTNDSNYADHPNENYARELLELHTLGVDQGYTQEDVREVARCFTGWAYSWEDDATLGRFQFYADVHDDGEKRVLGVVIPAGGGISDGERVLEILARHPNTATFIARKLLHFFWGYEPPASYVARIATVYRNTGGSIKAMLRVLLQRGWMATATSKLKRPAHLVTSAIRAVGGVAEEPWYLLDQTYTMGHLPFSWTPPNGYPDSRDYWQGFLLNRWNFPTSLIYPDWSSVTFDVSWLPPSRTPLVLVNTLDTVLFGGTMSAATRAQLQAFLQGPRNEDRIRQALGLALSSPDFQDY